MKPNFLNQENSENITNKEHIAEIYHLNEQVKELNAFIGKRSSAIHTQKAINKALKFKVQELELRLRHQTKGK